MRKKLTLLLGICLLAGNLWAEEASVTLPETLVTAEEEKNQAVDTVHGTIAQRSSTGTKIDAPLLETPRSISVVTEERFNEQGAQTIQDALVYSAGVYGATYGYDTRGDWALVRGTDAVQYTDGLKSLFGFYNNIRPHTYSLSSIEVLKGPGSVLYGQGTTGGTINLVSKRPQLESKHEFFTEYGSFDRREVGSDHTGTLDDNGELLYRFSGILRESNTQVDHVEDNSFVLNPSFTWNPSDKTNFTLLSNIQNNESGTATQFLPWTGTLLPGPNGRIPTSTFVSEPNWDRYDTKQRSITGMLNHKFDEVFSLNARARYSKSSSDYFSMWPDFAPTIMDDGHSVSRTVYVALKDARAFVSDVRLKADFETGFIKHQAGVGYDYQDSVLNEIGYYGYGEGGVVDIYNPQYGNVPSPEDTPLSSSPETSTHQNGLYLLDQMKIGDKWILSAGLRRDDAYTESKGSPGQSDDIYTKSLALMHHFENGLAPYVSYAESFDPILGTNTAGESYKPIEGEQYEAGIKYQPRGTQSLFTVSAFDLTEKNRLTSDPTNPNENLQTGETKVQGLEFENQFKLNDFDLLANYTVLDDEVTESNEGNKGKHIASVPGQFASAWATYHPSKARGFKLGAGTRYVGHSWDGTDSLKTPDYTLYDAMVGYGSGNWEVILSGRNLEDKTHVTTCLARGDCFYGERRTVALNVKYRF